MSDVVEILVILLVVRWISSFKIWSNDAKYQELKGQIQSLRLELSQTSAQDHFAKWARLRRSLDKKQSDYKEMSSTEALNKTKNGMILSLFQKSLTILVHLFLLYHYSKRSIFYLPIQTPLNALNALQGVSISLLLTAMGIVNRKLKVKND